MAINDDCPDCPDPPPLTTDGLCYWQGCEVKATEGILTNGIKYKGQFFPTGNIELCAGHLLRWQRLGRLDLKPEVVDAAALRQLVTGGSV